MLAFLFKHYPSQRYFGLIAYAFNFGLILLARSDDEQNATHREAAVLDLTSIQSILVISRHGTQGS